MNALNVQMFQGKVLVRLAKLYSNLVAVCSEVVQNAIDSGATRIAISADLPHRTLVVYDNGSGISRERIASALQSVGSTLKDRNKYGQFGLGLISPLWITKEFVVTSCPQPRRNGYTAFKFVRAEIEPQAQVSIPFELVENLEFDPTGKTWWRTKVGLSGITKDRRSSYLNTEELATEIALKYGEVIIDRSIDISIKIVGLDKVVTETTVVAPEFSGQKLEIYRDERRECGKVVVELFIAKLSRKGRQGAITFGTINNPSRITTKQYLGCVGEMLDSTVARALASGVFEGRVLCENVALHADRTKFENNDALFVLCEVLEAWYKKTGKQQIEEAAEQADDDRFQKIGVQAMPYAELLLRQDSFKHVAETISVGTIGSGHSKVPKTRVLGTDDATSIAGDGNPFEGKEVTGVATEPDASVGKPKEHPEHKPAIVYGPRGRKRVEVKGSSTGLRFEYVELEDFRVPFEFDPTNGLLSFNVRSPDWGSCEESDDYLQQFHILVITLAMSMELSRSDAGALDPEIKRFAFQNLSHQVFALKNGLPFLAKHSKP